MHNQFQIPIHIFQFLYMNILVKKLLKISITSKRFGFSLLRKYVLTYGLEYSLQNNTVCLYSKNQFKHYIFFEPNVSIRV